ncbi:MAG: 6-phosphofructokinase [Planctomycetes bacterium]|nr:6-phosphofructokinase [Planctomycetota bacterium]
MTPNPTIPRLAIVVGGGPAPGINGVISAVTIEADNKDIEVFGIQDGYHWLVKGDLGKVRTLQKHQVAQMYIRGGSMLGTSRTNPTKKKEDMDQVLECFRKMKFSALVSIGGDDTAYTASQIYRAVTAAGGSLRIAHVPKTIDNDLPLPGSTPTFGFETARHYGVSSVRNLAEDARTTGRWYIVVCMGRAAGHLALGIGKASAATLTIIPEEFGFNEKHKPNTIAFRRLCDTIVGTIIKRIENKKNYGVIVLAEGLIESVREELRVILDKTNGKYGTYETDDFDNLRMGEIEFGKLIRELVMERLTLPDPKSKAPAFRLHELLGEKIEPYGLTAKLIDKDLGYELRCADPIPFDAEYTRDLGYGAVKFLLSEEATKYGAVITFEQGRMIPQPFEAMIDPVTKKMRTRHVNIHGESFEVARRYMIRLQRRDFDNPEMLANLARVVKKTVPEFRKEFEYLVEPGASVTE